MHNFFLAWGKCLVHSFLHVPVSMQILAVCNHSPVSGWLFTGKIPSDINLVTGLAKITFGGSEANG